MRTQDKIEEILKLSKADDVIVIVRESSSANLRWANNTSTTNGLQKESSISIVSIIEGSVGSINATYFPEESLEKLVRDSEAACEGKPKAPDFMTLPEGAGFGEWDMESQAVDLARFEGVVADLARAFKQAESDDVLLFGYASESAWTDWTATSRGFRGSHSMSDGGFSMTLKNPDFSVSQAHNRQLATISEADVNATHERLMKRFKWSEPNSRSTQATTQ